MPDEYRIREHRGKFSLVYNDPDRATERNRSGRVRIALGTDDRGVAEARARDIWRARNAAPSERIGDLWTAYVTDRKTTVARKDRFESLWKALSPHFAHRLGTAVTKQDCRDYAADRKKAGKKPSTIRTELEFLRACLNHRYGKGKAPSLWMPPESAPRERYLTPTERDKLLEAIETPHVRLFVILALTTGARMSAILDLTWDRVDFRHGTVNLNPAGREITNKRRTVVALNPRALDALKEAHKAALSDHVIEYGGQRVKSVKKAIGAAARRSGVPCSPHVFRHTAGVWMAEADVPMEQIAQVLGHTSTRVTQKHYARFSPSFLRGAVAALNW